MNERSMEAPEKREVSPGIEFVLHPSCSHPIPLFPSLTLNVGFIVFEIAVIFRSKTNKKNNNEYYLTKDDVEVVRLCCKMVWDVGNRNVLRVLSAIYRMGRSPIQWQIRSRNAYKSQYKLDENWIKVIIMLFWDNKGNFANINWKWIYSFRLRRADAFRQTRSSLILTLDATWEYRGNHYLYLVID